MKTDQDNSETTVYIVKIKRHETVGRKEVEFDEIIGESTSLEVAQKIQSNHENSFLETQEVKKQKRSYSKK